MDTGNRSFQGKNVAITGAGGVLCGQFARALAMEGCNVAVLDHNAAGAGKTVEDIVSLGGRAEAFICDVLDKSSLEACHREVLSSFGKCDFLINGAGGNSTRAQTDDEYYIPENKDIVSRSFFDLEKEDIERCFSLNFLGTLLPTQVFARDMIARPGCCIVNISSMNSYAPLTRIPAYSAAKAAVNNLTQWMAVYFSRVGIRVNSIAPGFFATKQNSSLLFDADGQPSPRTEKILAATPMSRLGQPEELFGALKFLLDYSSSGFITGCIIPVDGGFSAYSGV